ncbi:MAG: hypothetical protein ACRC7N_02245 [Clostridium sp.]
MSREMNNGIEYVGIRKNLPQDAKLFGEINFYDTIDIDGCVGSIRTIVSATIDCKIVSTKVIDTIKGRANDGTVLLGNKLIVDGEYILKLDYVTTATGKTVFSNCFKYSKFGEITVPPKISGENIKDLNRRKKIRVNPYVEDLFVNICGSNRVNVNINIILNLE